MDLAVGAVVPFRLRNRWLFHTHTFRPVDVFGTKRPNGNERTYIGGDGMEAQHSPALQRFNVTYVNGVHDLF